jgi:CRP-like cAMP-binding protein
MGDHATTLYVILSGMVKIKSRGTFGDTAKANNTLMAGQSFGELALVKDTQRTTTVITTIFTELLVIHKEDYEVLKMTYEKDTDEKIEVLNKIEVFKTWPRSDLSRLANLMIFQKFPPNKVILKQGDTPQGIYFIKTGKCKIVKEMLISKNPSRKFQVT